MIVFLLIGCLFILVRLVQKSLLEKFNYCSRLNLDHKQELICTKKITFSHVLALLFAYLTYFFYLNFSSLDFITQSHISPEGKNLITAGLIITSLAYLKWVTSFKKNSLFYPILSFVIIMVALAGIKDIIKPENASQYEVYYFYGPTLSVVAFTIALFFSSIHFYQKKVLSHLLRSYVISSLTNVIAILLSQYLAIYLCSNLYSISCLILLIYLPMWLALVTICHVFNEYDSFEGDSNVQEIRA